MDNTSEIKEINSCNIQLFDKKRINNNSLEDTIELNDNINQKIDLYDYSKNIFEKIQNSYSFYTINKTEIFRAYNYTLKEMYNNVFKHSDLLKRAHFYFSLYHYLNHIPNNKFYEINNNKKTRMNKYSYSLDFLNTNFKEEKINEIKYLGEDNKDKEKTHNILNPPLYKQKNKIQQKKPLNNKSESSSDSSENICESEKSNEIVIENITINSSDHTLKSNKIDSNRDKNSFKNNKYDCFSNFIKNEKDEEYLFNKNSLISKKRKNVYDISKSYESKNISKSYESKNNDMDNINFSNYCSSSKNDNCQTILNEKNKREENKKEFMNIHTNKIYNSSLDELSGLQTNKNIHSSKNNNLENKNILKIKKEINTDNDSMNDKDKDNINNNFNNNDNTTSKIQESIYTEDKPSKKILEKKNER